MSFNAQQHGSLPGTGQSTPRRVSATSADTRSSSSSSSSLTSIDLTPTKPQLPPPIFYKATPSSPRHKEHFRDVPGPLTLHRVFLVLYLAAVPYAIYLLQDLVWPPSTDRELDHLWMGLGFVLLLPLPATVAWIFGALWFSYPTHLDKVEMHDHPVVFRIVSRGTNAECLLATVRRCQNELKRAALFPYLVEIVTDGDEFVAPVEPDLLHVSVPDSYATPNGTRFKARALHFASVNSRVPPLTWVVHLDEETQVTSSGVKGIADMIAKTERSGNVRRVGQGMIVYHRAWASHPFLTLADMRRTGDDLGHFFLQHRLGFTIFGLHGSFVVVRADVEREIGFDVGPQGSITEDAWWILQALQRGVRTCWIDGYMEEQSTQSVMDFLKQRRRWYVGLWKVGRHCPVPLIYRVSLLFNTLCWIVMPILLPLQVAYIVFSIVYGKHIVLAVRILTSLIAASSAGVYFTGLVVNMREHGTPAWRGLLWMLLLVVCLPFFYLMEACSIVMAFFSPLSENAKGFHVVVKSDQAESSDDSDTQSDSIDKGRDSLPV